MGNLMKETEILSIKNILIVASVICYGSITLNGEYGVSVFMDTLFRLTDVGFISKLFPSTVLFSLAYLITTVFRKNQNVGMVKYVLIGLLLTANLFVYSNQPQEHANPFDITGSFLWTFILFLCLYIAIGIEILKRNKQNEPV